MSETLAKAHTLSLNAESLYDRVELSGVKIKRAVTQEIILQRPDSLYFRSSRDDGKVREGRYDGKALTIVPKGRRCLCPHRRTRRRRRHARPHPG